MDFDEAYTGLTPSQKKAVDTVEGPVLVIAGPGTGKTHVLTLRVANILKKTQATPADILVLTFTDSAARTVRKRLGALIGEAAARDIGIFTFHSFADFVLKIYAESFPAFEGKRLAGDVESTLLWREVLETEEIVHLRTPKSPYFYLRDLESLHKDMVRERITLDDYRAWGKEEEERINKDESYRYTRDGKYGAKGDMKPEGSKKLKSLEKVYEATHLIEAYQKLKDSRDVYDFSDVLTSVVDALQTDEGLRSELQERYQYILADEHQDANAYQHALLDSFAYDEHPNLFVVGDEKQAIFRFQGADSTHFKEFVTKYPRTAVVALTESHRSLQGILDVAHMLAGTHIPASNGKHESLSATREGEAKVGLIVGADPLAEREEVALQIEQALKAGVAPEDIAVIAARNATVDLMSQHLSARGIPTLRAGDVSLSARPLVRSLLALMRAIGNPLDTASLREALLAPWWEMGIAERSGFLRRTRDTDLFPALRSQFPTIGEVVSSLQDAALSEAPLQIFSRILASSGARDYALSHPEHLEDVALIRRLYGYLEEVVARNPNVLFPEAVEALAKAHEHGLEWVKSSVLTRKGFVTVITTHRAKGMEWSQVFVVGLTENEWERGGARAKIPSPVDSARTVDDAVKQFYVAITRARDVLTLSYAAENAEGRERKPSAFIPESIDRLEAAADLTIPVLHSDVDAPERVRELTRDYLLNEGLSPSALDEYLDSPPTFFARRVLRLREPEEPRMLIGTAVHAGIAEYLESKDAEKAEAATAACLERSLLPRTTAFDQVCEDARARLAAYLKGHGALGEATAVEKIYSARKTFGDTEILLSGKIDAVLKRDGETRLVDFKTSTTVRGHEENYARQLAFYDLLLRENGEAPTGACIIQVRTDAIEEFPVPLNAQTREELMTTLEAVVPEMLSGTWRKGEASLYDGLLGLF